MIQVGFRSDKGLKRSNNEDAYFVVPSDSVYIVADGVGGNNAGEIASRTTVACVAAYIRNNPIGNMKKEADLRKYFTDCLGQANKEIYMLAKKYEENKGMATTIVIGYIAGKKGYIINVGDSRAYIYRNGAISQVTEDHTYVNTLLKKGVITEEEAKLHPQKNMITKAIGGDALIEPDFFRIDLKAGDIILLCTDGLHGEVEESKMAEILGTGGTMSEICAKLVDKANRNGGRDNITVICLKI